MIGESIARLPEVGIPENPFPGLRPFELEESHIFFGREGQSEKLIAKLERRRFLAVVGVSGSGKSSLVRAGFLPALLGGFMPGAGSNWRVAIMRPGNMPTANLARALNSTGVFGSEEAENAAIQIAVTEETLRRGNLGLVDAVRHSGLPPRKNFESGVVSPAQENLLVVVDQFEEIFRSARASTSDEFANEAAAFVKLLLAAVKQSEFPIYVVLTMRSDYLGDCAEFPGLPEAINEAQYLIPRLTRDELYQAIAAPIAVAGAEITLRLINRLLCDVSDNPRQVNRLPGDSGKNQDQLPILQHALMRTWYEWKNKTPEHQAKHEGEAIDLCCYETIGGMDEALSRHADEAFFELPDDDSRRIAERMFKCLTEKSAGNRETRRPVTLGEICSVTEANEDEVIAVIETFRKSGRSFLTPPADVKLNSQSLIDISHESLIRNWQRLRKWVEDEEESAHTYYRLAETAALYERKKAELLRGVELATIWEWREQKQPNKAWARRYHPDPKHFDFKKVMDFLDQSREVWDAEELERRRQRERELRFRRTRLVTFALAIAFLLSLIGGWYVWLQRQEAVKAKQDADEQRLKAENAEQNALYQSQLANEQKDIAKMRGEEAERARQEAEVQGQLALRERDIAEKHRQDAVKASEKAEMERQSAVEEKNLANMSLAQYGFQEGNYQRVKELLGTFLPTESPSGQDDARSFYWYYLWRRVYTENSPLIGHTGYVYSVAFSPDGKTLASASTDNTVKLWDAQSGREVGRPLQGHEGTVNSIAFSPDGDTLASASDDRTIRLWDVQCKLKNAKLEEQGRQPSCKEEIAKLEGYSDLVYSVAFSSDDKTLASASADHTVKLWDVQDRKKITGKALPQNHTNIVYSVAFSPDGKTLASASADRLVKLWDVEKKEEIASFRPHLSYVRSVAFSPSGSTLASAGNDGTIRLWDVRKKQFTSTLRGHVGYVRSVIFLSDDRLASGGNDRTVRLWDIKGRKEIAWFDGHKNAVVSVAFSSDSNTLASGSVDNTIRLWDVQSKPEVTRLRGGTGTVSSVAFSQDKGMIASGSIGTVKLWDTREGKEIVALQAGKASITSVAFSPNGRMLAGASADRKIRLWDVQSKEEIATLAGHTEIAQSVAFSPDGKLLASASRDRTIRLWDVERKQEVAKLEGHTDSVYCVNFSREGLLASASLDRSVRLWDLKGGREIAKLEGHSDSVSFVAFSLDGKTLASASYDRTVLLWDVQSRQKIATLKGHTGLVRSVAFSPDGRTLASAGNDRAIRLWDVRRQQEIAALEGDDNIVNSVAFSPDGRTLASGNAGGTIRLWFAATDKEVADQRNKGITKE